MRVRMFVDMFKVFDRDHDGMITAGEFGREMAALFGWRPTVFESERLLSSVDMVRC